MGGVLQKGESPKAYLPETKLEAKIVGAMQRRESEGSSAKSFNSIILKFPKIDENLRKCNAIFLEFGLYQNPCIVFLRLHLKFGLLNSTFDVFIASNYMSNCGNRILLAVYVIPKFEEKISC